jgi:hypothetical protein
VARLVVATGAVLVLISGSSSAARTTAAERVCAVTQPRGSSYGNGGLTTALWPFGVVVADSTFIRRDGAVKMKFPWWRDTPGELHVSGRRLDAKAPPLKVEVAEGYGLKGLQPTYLIFSTAGCWRITARAGDARLAFTTLVVKLPHLRPRRYRAENDEGRRTPAFALSQDPGRVLPVV